MIKNQKGQAFFEFVLILPIIVLLLLGIVSIGILYVKKSELDNQVMDIIYIWQNQGTSIEELKILLKKEDFQVSITENTTTSFLTIQVKKNITLINPIIKSITIQIKRVIPFEQ